MKLKKKGKNGLVNNISISTRNSSFYFYSKEIRSSRLIVKNLGYRGKEQIFRKFKLTCRHLGANYEENWDNQSSFPSWNRTNDANLCIIEIKIRSPRFWEQKKRIQRKFDCYIIELLNLWWWYLINQILWEQFSELSDSSSSYYLKTTYKIITISQTSIRYNALSITIIIGFFYSINFILYFHRSRQ